MARSAQSVDLTQGVIWKGLLAFFLPIAVGTLFQQLYNTVDAVIVGRFVGSDALAAVGGSAAMILQLLVGLFVGLSSGATVVISHFFGAKDREKLSKAVHTAVAFSLAAGAGLTIVGILIAPGALQLTQNPPEIMEDSTLYLRLYFLGTIPMMLFNMGSGILRAVGDSKSPLYYLIFCCVANIGLDLLFVAGLGLGVAGAAIATALAMACSALLILRRLMHSQEAFRLRPQQIHFHGPSLLQILHIGIPAAIESSMYSLSNLVIQVPINTLGTDVVAAWSATGKVDGIYWALMTSFGVAVLAFIGQNYGAGKYDRMRQSVRVCLRIGFLMTVALSVPLLLLARYCFAIFTDNQAVIQYATQIVFYFVPFYFIWTVIEVFSNTLRGAGDAIIPMVISVGGICGVRILWVLLLIPHWNSLLSISMCYPISWFITAVVLLVYYRRGHWLRQTSSGR